MLYHTTQQSLFISLWFLLYIFVQSTSSRYSSFYRWFERLWETAKLTLKSSWSTLADGLLTTWPLQNTMVINTTAKPGECLPEYKMGEWSWWLMPENMKALLFCSYLLFFFFGPFTFCNLLYIYTILHLYITNKHFFILYKLVYRVKDEHLASSYTSSAWYLQMCLYWQITHTKYNQIIFCAGVKSLLTPKTKLKQYTHST